MKHRSLILLLIILALSIVFKILHLFVFEYFLFWRFWWFDTIMHFLGGVLVALVVIWTLRHIQKLEELIQRQKYFWSVVLLVVFAVGVSWEVFELIAGLQPAQNYVLDTGSDLLMDIVGGSIACILLFKTRLMRVLE